MAATRQQLGILLFLQLFLLLLVCSPCSCLSSSPPAPPSARGSSSSRVVRQLPGFDGELPFELETGYVEVDHTAGVHLFYYFIRSERRPAEDALLLWLTGGPGCSAFSGLVYEVGPLTFDLQHHGGGVPKLVYKPESWTKLTNVIFLDSPVGTGFSYADTDAGLRTSDTIAVHQILVFLNKWFQELHPEFLSNPLYIAGDSYSGMIVPAVTFGIATAAKQQPSPNLKGYLLGNPVTDDSFDRPSRIPFAHGMGLISDELYEAYKKSCSVKDNTQQQSVQCTNTLDAIDACVKDIYGNHILEPYCTFASPHHPHRLINKPLTSGVRQMLQLQDLHLSEISSECRTAEYTMSRIWANNDTVREALGIQQGTVPLWQRCNYDVLYTSDIKSSLRNHLDLTARGYRSLIYSGDHDMIIPFIGTQDWIRSLNFSVVDEWRPWFVDGQVAGYTRSYSNNLTFATVKGGGHTAPEYMPKQCLAMLARWVSGDPL